MGLAQAALHRQDLFISLLLEQLQVETYREMKQVNRKTSYWFSSDSSSLGPQAIKSLA